MPKKFMTISGAIGDIRVQRQLGIKQLISNLRRALRTHGTHPSISVVVFEAVVVLELAVPEEASSLQVGSAHHSHPMKVSSDATVVAHHPFPLYSSIDAGTHSV